MPVEGALDSAMAARRDHRLDLVGGQMVEDGIGVVSLVGTHRMGLQALQQRQRLGAVASLAAGQSESGQRAQAFDEGVNLGAQSAARSTERLVALFLGAPAAC